MSKIPPLPEERNSNGQGVLEPDPIPRQPEPAAIFPLGALRDGRFCAAGRVLVALQLLGATFATWSRPVGPADIGKLTGQARETVRRALPGLVEAGYIERRGPVQHRGGAVFRYRLTFGLPGVGEVGS